MNTIIEKIRAEVNRLKPRIRKICGKEVKIPVEKVREKFDNILFLLYDLEKEEKPINPTIEKLRALIKMQIRREELNFASLGGGGQTMNIGALEWVLKQLDTLQEPIDKWSNKERKARVKKTGEIVCGFTDGQGHFDIPTDHNEFIRYNLDELEFDTLKEQPVDTSEDERINTAIFKALSKKDARDVLKECGVDVGDALDYLKRQSKEQPVCEGLEEEYKDYVENDPVYSKLMNRNAGLSIARHFAKWQKEQMMKSPLVSIGNTASEELQRINYENGKKDMREQMMKEAVEGEVCGRVYDHINVRFADGVCKYLEPKNISHIPADVSKYNIGQKVRIIIVKED